MKATVSRTRRIDWRGGKTNSFCAWYSFKMSFCNVPPNFTRGTPAFSAWATNIAKRTAAGELIVIEVVMPPRSISAKRSRMSAKVSIATPHRPTSPNDMGSSESKPINVGMSKAVDRPSPPDFKISLKRWLVSIAVPKPAKSRIVHNLERYIEAYGPRVYG